MAMEPQNNTFRGQDIEMRTQELGRQLYRLGREYRPTVTERWQDNLMLHLASDPKLRSRLLRFVDVLASLDLTIAAAT